MPLQAGISAQLPGLPRRPSKRRKHDVSANGICSPLIRAIHLARIASAGVTQQRRKTAILETSRTNTSYPVTTSSVRQNNVRTSKEEHIRAILTTDCVTPAGLEYQMGECKIRERQGIEVADGRERRNDGNDSDGNEGASEDHAAQTIEACGGSYFDDLLKSPTKAKLLFYMNSGLFRFDQYKDFRSEFVGTNIDTERMCKLVEDEKLSEDEWCAMIKEYFKVHPTTTGNLFACGCCGTKFFERMSKQSVTFRKLFFNHEDAQVIAYSSDEVDELQGHLSSGRFLVNVPVDDDWNTKEVDLSKARSYYELHTEQGSSFWHVHPELVEQCEQTARHFVRVCYLCDGQLRKKKRPKYSIANGVDFGYSKRIGLEEPNLHEQLIISRTRLFFTAVKLSTNVSGVVNSDSGNVLKCHAILFSDDSHQKAAYMYNPSMFEEGGLLHHEDMKWLLRLFMMDPDGNPDKLFQRVFDSHVLIARSYVVAQWLLALKWLHPRYSDLVVDDIEKVRAAIARIKLTIRHEAVAVDDEDLNAFDSQAGSDVAGVQNIELSNEEGSHRRRGSVGDASADDNMPVSYSYVAKSEGAHLLEDNDDFRIRALHRFVDEDINSNAQEGDEQSLDGLLFDKDRIDDYLRKNPFALRGCALRGRTPYCDFAKDDLGITTSFPHVFLLGKAYGRPAGRLGQEARFHLLNQFTNVPGTDRRLLGFLFDVKQRIAVMDGVKNYVDGSAGSIKELQNLLERPEEKAKLKEALANPYRESSKKLRRTYLRYLRFAGKDVSYGATEGSSLKHQVIGCTKRFSTPNCFLTISPSTLSNPRCIRLASNFKNNKCFPSIFESGCPSGEDGSAFMRSFGNNGTISSTGGVIHLPKDFRARLSISNPASFVAELKILLFDVMHLLLGVRPENPGFYGRRFGNSSRKTEYFRSRKGTFGYTLNAAGVTEATRRGYLHWHINVTAGPSSYLMQRMSFIPDVCEKISRVLDNMYRSKVPKGIHVGNLVSHIVKKRRGPWQVPDGVVLACQPANVTCSFARAYNEVEVGRLEPRLDDRIFERQIDEEGSHKNMHYREHVHRCHAGLYGMTGCSLSMPQSCTNSTAPVLLKKLAEVREEDLMPEVGNEPDSVWRPPVSFEAIDVPTETNCHHRLQNVLDKPKAEQVIVWETARPTINPCEFDPRELPESQDELRVHVIEVLRRLLSGCETYKVHSSDVFWTWIEGDAEPQHLRKLCQYLYENLPNANGYVATFNPVISLCTGSHNNACLLGSSDQARSAMFYIIPYESKNKFPLGESLPILQKALDHLRRFPSTYDSKDKGTMKRTVKHLLTRVLNRMHLSMEISDWQIAAALLELPSVFSTEQYQYYNPSSLRAFALRKELEDEDGGFFQRLYEAGQERGLRSGDNWAWTNEQSRRQFVGEQQHEVESNVDEVPGQQEGEDTHDDRMSTVNEIGPSRVANELIGVDLGYIKKVKLNKDGPPENPERDVLVPDCMFYCYRGLALESVSYYEYTACFQFTNTKPDPSKENPANMHQQRQFCLHDDCPFVFDGFHVIRSKQRTPLALGRVPSHPGPQPENVQERDGSPCFKTWKEKADAFAAYYLTTFRPFRIDDGQGYLWDDLVSWVEGNSEAASVIPTFRNMILNTHVLGIDSSDTTRKLTSEYRNRSRDLWSEEKRSDLARKAYYDRKEKERSRAARLTVWEEHVSDEIPKRKRMGIGRQLQYDEEQNASLEVVTPTRHERSQMWHESERHRHPVICDFSARQVLNTVDRIRTWKQSVRTITTNDSVGRRTLRSSRLAKWEKIKNVMRTLEPSGTDSQQLRLLRQYAKHLMNEETDEEAKFPNIVIVHGGPGVGKTTLRNAMLDVATICGRYALKVSYNSVNAAEMNGETVSSFIQSNAEIHQYEMGSFQPVVLKNLRDDGFRVDSVICVEEFETCAPWHLSRFDKLCQYSNGVFEPFGGCLTVLVGDTSQLGPVKAGLGITQAIMDLNLPESLKKRKKSKAKKQNKGDSLLPAEKFEDRKYHADSPYVTGSKTIVEHARWFELTEQRRSVDHVHTRIVTDTYRGKQITVQTLKDNGYKLLSKDDLLNDDWLRCPVLVRTNRERFSMQFSRAKEFAASRGTHVLRWSTSVKKWNGMPQSAYISEAMQDPIFYEMFVQDSFGLLKSVYSKGLRLINGTKIRYHSLCFDHDHQLQLNVYLRETPVGEVITLPFDPVAVMVQVYVPGLTSREALDYLLEESYEKLEDGVEGPCRIIIPIHPLSSKPTDRPVPVYGGEGFPSSEVIVQSKFPIEPTFAMTVYKSLGATLDKVIVALSHNPAQGCDFSHQEVHVSLSRVRDRDSMRLLLVGSNETEQWQSLAYLASLRQDPSIQYFLNGFRPYNKEAPNENWKTNRWCQKRANDMFETYS